MKRILVLAGLMVVIGNVQAQPKQFQKADGKKTETIAAENLVKQLMENAEVTGLSIAIINDNKPVYVKAFGYKN